MSGQIAKVKEACPTPGKLNGNDGAVIEKNRRVESVDEVAMSDGSDARMAVGAWRIASA